MNAQSANIRIFPISVTRNAEGAHNGRVLSEDNLTTLIRALTDRDSFIVRYEESESIEFILGGYYIKLTEKDILNKTNLWASISIVKSAGSPSFPMLSGDGDADSKYTGVSFSEEEPSGTYKLQLKANGVIPEASRIRFTSINGGIV